MTAILTCMSIDCPERKSICCGAPSSAMFREEKGKEDEIVMFVCSKCGKEFKGGECDTTKRIADEYPFNTFYGTTKREIQESVEAVLESQKRMFKKLIQDEILICHEEGTPTSRLTSLWMKLDEL